MSTLPSVILVHPSTSYRHHLHAALTSTGFKVVGEARAAASALVIVQNRPCDVLVLGHCGAHCAQLVTYASRTAGLEVVVLSRGDDLQFVADMLVAGANGVAAEDTVGELPGALREVLAGGSPLPRQQVRALVEESRRRLELHDRNSAWSRLSQRQRDVLELARRGHSTHEISAELCIEPATVRSHLSSAMRRLGVVSRSEAAELLEPPLPRQRPRTPEASAARHDVS